MTNIVPERRCSRKPRTRLAGSPARGRKEITDGILLNRPARVRRGGRHRSPRLHRCRVGPGDPAPRRRHQGAVLRRGSRLHLDGLRPRRDCSRLYGRQGLGLPHQPGRDLRARRHEALPVEGRTALLGRAARRRRPRRTRHVGLVRHARSPKANNANHQGGGVPGYTAASRRLSNRPNSLSTPNTSSS